ncbi:unnamed protein product, partial [Closterium sp. NIES-65]
HVLLPRSAYISDLLVDYGTAAQVGQSRGQQVVCKLLLRKRWFDRADADVAERQFVRLCYVQLRRDYMESRYLVTAEGAVVLAALQIAAEIGVIPDPLDAPEWLALMTKSVPAIVSGAMSEDEWAKQIAAQYKTLWSLDHEGTMREFTRIILDSPHGGSVFFPLRPHPDIAASFPKRMEVGINHNGLHFLNPEDHSLVLEAELKDIAEYAGKPGRVYFSLLMRNQLCSLEFATKGGEEITQLLDRHIANAVRQAIHSLHPPPLYHRARRPLSCWTVTLPMLFGRQSTPCIPLPCTTGRGDHSAAGPSHCQCCSAGNPLLASPSLVPQGEETTQLLDRHIANAVRQAIHSLHPPPLYHRARRSLSCWTVTLPMLFGRQSTPCIPLPCTTGRGDHSAAGPSHCQCCSAGNPLLASPSLVPQGEEITQLLDRHIANAVRQARGEHVGVESESGIGEEEERSMGRGGAVEKGRVMVRQEGLLMPSLRMSQGAAAAVSHGSSRPRYA